MKKTIITLASVATLAGAANAQTVTNHTLWGNPFQFTSDAGTNTFAETQGDWSNTPLVVNGSSRQLIAQGGSNNPIYTMVFTAAKAGTISNLVWNVANTADASKQTFFSRLTANNGQINILKSVLDGATDTSQAISGPFNINAGDTITLTNSTNSIAGNEAFINARFDFTAAAVPEPSSTALLGLGTLGFLARRRR